MVVRWSASAPHDPSSQFGAPWRAGTRRMKHKNPNMASLKKTNPNKRSRTKSDGDSDSDAEVRRKCGTWPSWLVVQGTDSENPLAKVSPFALAKGIKGLSGEPKSCKRLRDGSLLVECASKLHSDMLLRSTELVNCPIKVTPHKGLNSSKGVIRCRELLMCSEAEIKHELAPQGVTDVHQVLARRGQDRIPTSTYFLTFCTPTLPQHLKVGFLRVKVSLYIPSPLRCFKCQRFGHTQDRCTTERTCGLCAKVEHEGPCDNPALCVNCRGGHPSSSKSCPIWMKEKEIQKVKTERRISFFDARKEVEARQPVFGLSFSAVVGGNKPKMVSSCVQTDESMFKTKTASTASSRGLVSATTSHPGQQASKPAAKGGKTSAGASAPPPSPTTKTTSTAPSGGTVSATTSHPGQQASKPAARGGKTSAGASAPPLSPRSSALPMSSGGSKPRPPPRVTNARPPGGEKVNPVMVVEMRKGSSKSPKRTPPSTQEKQAVVSTANRYEPLAGEDDTMET